jgi:sec-independent protein translocase protein TatA
MPTLGPTELIIILVIVILIFGVNKIPKLGKGLGEGIRNFKTSLKEVAATDAKEPQDKEERS